MPNQEVTIESWASCNADSLTHPVLMLMLDNQAKFLLLSMLKADTNRKLTILIRNVNEAYLSEFLVKSSP